MIVGGACGRYSRGLVVHAQVADQVARGFHDEDTLLQLRGQPIADVRCGCPRRGVVRECAVRAHRLRAIAPVHRGRLVCRVHGDIVRELFVHAARRGELRIAHGVVRRHEVGAQRILVAVAVDPPGLVLRDPPLAFLGRLAKEYPAVVPHAELASVVGVVDPVVDAPHEAIGQVLRIAAAAVIGADQLLRVGAEVAVGVMREPEVGRCGHEDAVVEHLHGARQHETVHEDRGLVHPAIPVRILEHDDAAYRAVLAGALQVRHEAAHLDDVHAAVGIEVDGDGILHERFRRHEFQAVSGQQVKKRLLLGSGVYRRNGFRRARVRGRRAVGGGWNYGDGRHRCATQRSCRCIAPKAQEGSGTNRSRIQATGEHKKKRERRAK